MMRRSFLLLAVLAASVLPVAQALAQEAAGQVSMRMGRGSMLLSITGGEGTLTFQGGQHPFRLGGLGIGLLGVTSVEAEGEVFGLNTLADFPGVYVQGEADYALGGGEGILWLRNTRGVTMRLRSRTKGVSLAVGGEGLVIQMGAVKKEGKGVLSTPLER